MTITTALILLIVTIVGVGVALAGVIIPANNRPQPGDCRVLRQEVNQDIASLRQEINQDITGLRQEIKQEISGLRQEINQRGQQITQVAHEVGHLAGLLEGLRGRPIAEPEEVRV